MDQVVDELRRIGRLAVAEPTEAVVAADVRRGLRALHRRRLRAGGAVAATMCVGGAVAIGALGRNPSVPPYVRASPIMVGTGTPSTGRAVRLVAYQGPQYPGFVVARVPAGFVLQGVSDSVLAIARPEDHTPIDTFVGKLVVTVEASDETAPQQGAPVIVNGAPGTLRRSDDGTATLSYPSGDDVVQVQAWHDVAMTDQQLVSFAEGITVTAHAQRSHG